MTHTIDTLTLDGRRLQFSIDGNTARIKELTARVATLEAATASPERVEDIMAKIISVVDSRIREFDSTSHSANPQPEYPTEGV